MGARRDGFGENRAVHVGVSPRLEHQRAPQVVGVVRGEDGAVLAGATITVENPATGARGTATTDADGRYAVAGLPVEGKYAVRAALAGFATSPDENITFDGSRRATIDFVLKI